MIVVKPVIYYWKVESTFFMAYILYIQKNFMTSKMSPNYDPECGCQELFALGQGHEILAAVRSILPNLKIKSLAMCRDLPRIFL